MIVNTDIDIDVADRNKLLDLIKHTPAMINDNGRRKKHNTGVYFHEMPSDPFTGLSTIDHKEAEELGYFKIDVLNNHVYESVESEAHLDRLIDTEPLWELFGHKEIVDQLFHVNKHYDIIKQHMPTSIEQLAMILAMIRPGKRYLVGNTWEVIEKEVWEKTDEYFFKKSHAVGYAVAIIVQLNLICEQANRSS